MVLRNKIIFSFLLGFSLNSCGIFAFQAQTGDAQVVLQTNIRDLELQNIESLKLDGKEITDKEYSVTEGKIILPDLDNGRHILGLKVKNSENIDIPLEISGSKPRNFQFNASLKDNSIDSWEVGLDADKDGKIDDGAYFSRNFDSYVIVRDTDGSLKYLEKNNFSQNYREFSSSKTPDNFSFPEIKENDLSSEKGIKLFDLVDQSDPHKDIIEGLDELDSPFGGNYVIKFPDYKELEGFWISAITNEDTLIPVTKYIIRKEYLILDKKTFRNQKILNIYLNNANDDAYLMKMESSRPSVSFLSRSSGPQGAQPGGRNNAIPPQGAPQSQGLSPNDLPGTDPKAPPPPQKPPDGVPRNTLVSHDLIKFSLEKDIHLTPELFSKLTIYEEKNGTAQQLGTVDKKLALLIPGRNEYSVIASDGNIEAVISEEEAKKRKDIILITGNN